MELELSLKQALVVFPPPRVPLLSASCSFSRSGFSCLSDVAEEVRMSNTYSHKKKHQSGSPGHSLAFPSSEDCSDGSFQQVPQWLSPQAAFRTLRSVSSTDVDRRGYRQKSFWQTLEMLSPGATISTSCNAANKHGHASACSQLLHNTIAGPHVQVGRLELIGFYGLM